MANIIDSLLIAVKMDNTDLDKGLKQAESKVSSFADRIKAGALAKFGALASVGFIMSEVKNLTAVADELGKIADRIGADAPKLQSWAMASKLAGGSVQSFYGTAERLGGELQRIAVTGKSRLLPFFESMGVATLDAAGKARDVFDVLTDVAEAVEGMDKATSSGMLKRLQLDEGTIGLLQMGKKGMQDLIRYERELGVFQKEDTVIAANYNDAMDRLTRSLNMTFLPVMRMFAPVLTEAAKAMTSAFVFMQKHSLALEIALAGIALVVTALVLPSLWSLFVAIMTNPITWIIAAIVGLILILEDLYVYAKGGKSQFESLWKTLGTGEEVMAAIQGAWDFLKIAAQIAWEVLKAILKGLWMILHSVLVLVAGLGVAAAQAFKAIGGFINDYFIKPLNNAWDTLKKIIDNLPSLDGVKDFLGGRYEQFFTPITPQLAGAGAGGNKTLEIGKIDIHTQATNADGIAADIGKGINKNSGLYWGTATGTRGND
nr:MAG TPA: tail tape measure [Caudoviricetes sp.]